MSRDGAGVYSKPAGSTAVSGTTIESAKFNTLIDDIVDDLNLDRPIAAGGTAASTAAGARANLSVRNLVSIDTTGSSNAYVVTSTDSLTPSDGDPILIIANHTNTGAATLNVDSTGAVAIKKMIAGTATALAANDIYAGHHYLLTYDAGETAWLIVGHVTLSASSVTITDSGGHYTGTEVETALQEAAVLTQGQHTIYIPAAAMQPTVTNGAAYATQELATNDVMVVGYDFDASTSEKVQFSFQSPKSADETVGIVAQAIWKDAATAGTGTVTFGFQILAVGNDDAMDAAFGTAQTATDTFIASGDAHVGPETSAITPAGTWAAEDLLIVQVYRDISDTYTQDARLIGVRLHVTTNANTDD